MLDIAVDGNMDIVVTEDGDISLYRKNIPQAVRTRLQWIYGEWRLGPELGFPWFEDVLVKNPNMELVMSRIRTAIMEVDGVESCSVELYELDRSARTVRFGYKVSTAEGETIQEEVKLNV
jgi:hypothetical protein